MSKMKSNFQALAYFSLASAMTSPDFIPSNVAPSNRKNKKKLSKEDFEKKELQNQVKLYQAKGLKEFFFGENSLWALNQKSANKKAKARNWIV